MTGIERTCAVACTEPRTDGWYLKLHGDEPFAAYVVDGRVERPDGHDTAVDLRPDWHPCEQVLIMEVEPDQYGYRERVVMMDLKPGSAIFIQLLERVPASARMELRWGSSLDVPEVNRLKS